MFWLNSMYNVCMLNKKGYKNMFNLQNFLNTHEVTVTNLKTLLKNGVKTVKLYDEECDCFEEQTVDIQNLLDNIEDSIYWVDVDDCLYVSSTSYRVFFTAEKALVFCLNYTADWSEGDITQIVTKKGILNSSYVSDELELNRLHNTVIEFIDWNDDKTTCTQRDRLVDIVYNNKDDIQKIYY